MATSGAWRDPLSPEIASPAVSARSEAPSGMSELGSSPPLPIARTPRRSVLGPLHEPLFRSLWIAAVVSYTGRWMQTVGAGWLMTSLTMSPLMVGLVQAASSVAVFLVVLPAGAIADVIDRRKLLLFTQSWMVVAAAALGVLTLAGRVTPFLLLLFTFLIGFGAVLNDPAWQAITPEVVSHEHFAAGVALNSAGYNVARAVGPALGGVVIAATSSGVAFLLNAVSLFGVIYFLARWKRHPGPSWMRADHMFRTMFDGFRYLRNSHAMKCVLIRCAVFSISAGALPALLPLLAHPFGSVGYGLLLAFFGLGAVIGATILPALRHRMSVDLLVSTSTIIFALMTFAAGHWPSFAVLSITNLVGGVVWIQILASLNVSAQTMSPVRMRARAISMYLLILQGGFAGGAALWGAIAERVGVDRSLSYAAAALALGAFAAFWFRLHNVEIQPTSVGMD
jgi:predicted MFS family arabinose efflux permease